MAFLIVGASTVPVAPGGAGLTQDEVGDRHRAFDGTYRSSVRDQLKVWRVETSPMPRSDADTLLGILNSSTQPVTCQGDLLDSTGLSCDTQFDSWTPIISSTSTEGHGIVMSFTLRESS